jgi:predicted nucleic acid-binding protein
MARAGSFRLDVSDQILDELVTVLRDDFHWDGYRMQFARQGIARIANLVTPTQTLAIIKEDPDDNRILECAVAAVSAVIVTRDKDLLRLKEYQGIEIVTPEHFLKHHAPLTAP